MKKRLQLDLFLEGLSQSELALLKALKARSSNLKDESSMARLHDCGHDEGKPCKNVVKL
jgi:hypothetical protein|tara:strand:+ start:672 stop:848 length:177 start_codon:yes stop_codon:yes gene_type:complete